MAVSYVSQTIKSSPYVLPLDMALFEKVMTVKQTQFNQGAAKIQGQIDALGSLDVMKEGDRNYLNEKINNLVTNLNGLGGVDLSDSSVLNQVESMGGDIYSDDKVITAISSTKAARSLINNYQELKTNPKMKGMYSEVNEAYDTRHVREWLADPTVGKAYNGPTSATPYNDYKTSMMKALDKVKADENVIMDDKGLFWEKTSGKFVEPERILSLARDLLDPSQREQMKRDGWFLYTGKGSKSPQEIAQALVGKTVDQHNERYINAQLQQQRYENMARASVGDPTMKQKYLQLADKAKADAEVLKAQAPTVAQTALDRFQADPEELMYHVYSNDFNRGLANLYSVSKTDKTIVNNTAAQFKLKLQEDQRQFNITATQNDEKIDLMRQKVDIDALKEGFEWEIDANGKRVLVNKNTTGASSLTGWMNDTRNPSDLEITENKLHAQNEANSLAINQEHLNLIQKMGQQFPDLVESTSSDQATGGLLYSLKGQAAFEGENKAPGFQMEDLAGLADPRRRGDLIKKAGITEKQAQVLTTWYNNYEKELNGDVSQIGNIPVAIKESVEKVRMLQNSIKTNEAKVKSINDAAISQLGFLSDNERNVLKDALSNPSKYGIDSKAAAEVIWEEGNFAQKVEDFLSGKGIGGKSPADKRIQSITEKIKKNGGSLSAVQKKREELFAQLATRDNFNAQMIGKDHPLMKNNTLANMVFSDMSNQNFEAVGDSPALSASDVKLSDIVPFRKGFDDQKRQYVDAQVVTGKGDNEKTGVYRVYINNPKNSKALSLYTDPYESLNHSVDMMGMTPEKFPVSYGKLGVNVRLRRKGDNPNDASAQAVAIYMVNGQEVPIPIPGAEGATASEAFAIAKSLIKEAASKKLTWPQLKDYWEQVQAGTR